MTPERLIKLSAAMITVSGNVGRHQFSAAYAGFAWLRAGGRSRRRKMRTRPNMTTELTSVAPIASVASRR